MSNISIPTRISVIRRILLFWFLSAVCFACLSGQDKVEITRPSILLVNDTMIIRYGFVGSKPWDVFSIRLEITDSSGRPIAARSFTGDIGDSIFGGQQKLIFWNMAADNVFINQNIYVEVVGEKLKTLDVPAAKTGSADSLAGRTIVSGIPEMESEKGISEKEAKVTAYKKHNVLLSCVVPGWGLTRLSDGKPYWLMGIAGFGCIASSVYFNRQAVTDYDGYKNSMDIQESQDLFDKANQHYLISNICAYTAAAIWVVDLGAVILRDRHVRKSAQEMKLSHLSVGAGYHAGTQSAFVAMNYRF
jgi:hypothetical protein